MKWKLFVLLFLFCGFIGGCATVPRTHESLMQNPVYRSATPDNRESILARKIGTGMSIPECKLSWAPKSTWDREPWFEFLRSDSFGNETWRVPNCRENECGHLYLHLRNGRIVYTSFYADR
jgi:hypothetical protein